MHGDMTTWLTWFFALNVADVLLTLYVIKHGGSEKNDILAKWFTQDDPDVVLIRIKALLLSLVWVVFYVGLLPQWALVALVLAYFALAGHNVNSAMKVWERTHNT